MSVSHKPSFRGRGGRSKLIETTGRYDTMAYNLLSWERDQSYLMPPSMRDWLSEGHLAWFIVDAVGSMQSTEVMAGVQRPTIRE